VSGLVAEPGPPQQLSGIRLVDSAQALLQAVERKSWVEAGLAGTAVALDTLAYTIDPIGFLAQGWLSAAIEYFEPLRKTLDWLAGEPAVIEAYARTWQNIGDAVGAVAEDHGTATLRGVEAWGGVAGDSYRHAAAQRSACLASAASCAYTVSAVVSTAGVLVATVRALVRDLVAFAVATVIARLPQWLAEEAVTGGLATPHVLAAISVIVARTVNQVEQVLLKMVVSLSRLEQLSKQLVELWEAILRGLRLRPGTEEPAPTGPKPVDFTEPSSAKPRGTTDGSKIEWDPRGTTNGYQIDRPPPRFQHMREEIAEIKSRWPNSNEARKRAVGVAEYIGSDGRNITLRAASGEDVKLRNTGLVVDDASRCPLEGEPTNLKPENLARELGMPEKDHHHSRVDPDFKMLEDLDHRLPPDAKGELRMYIDHKEETGPCTACSAVFDQFQARHPGVKIEVATRKSYTVMEAK
jgi:hypothetical protein